MQKKSRCSILILCLFAFMLVGCSPIVEDIPEPMNVYASFYPIYALAQMVVGDVPDVSLNCLVQPQDGCLRDYELSDWDIYMLAYGADAVLMGGCGLESYEETLEAFQNDGPVVAEVLYGLDLADGESSESDEEDSHWNGFNPHLYMSIEGSVRILDAIAASMSVIDPGHAAQYVSNQETAARELEELRENALKITQSCRGKKTALLNEALVYVADEYGLETVGYFERESGEALYGSDLTDCIDRFKASEAELILIEKQAPEGLVQALEDAGFAVASIDIFSTGQSTDGAQGYLDAHLSNAQAIAKSCM